MTFYKEKINLFYITINESKYKILYIEPTECYKYFQFDFFWFLIYAHREFFLVKWIYEAWPRISQMLAYNQLLIFSSLFRLSDYFYTRSVTLQLPGHNASLDKYTDKQQFVR